MKKHILTGALLLALAFVPAGCRGVESENEPFHPIWNMDNDAAYEPQDPNDLFADGRAMRQPAPGTVPRGFLREDERFYTGRTEGGNYVEEVPLPVTEALLQRGRERFNIYCAVCHGKAGDGQGIIMTGNYGYTPAPTYHKTALRDTADGYLFDVISNGVRNMPGYGAQVAVADRWAIVTYIRALQRSQNATRENVPPSVLARIEQTGSANMNAARNPSSGSGASASGSGAASSEDTTGSGSGGSAPSSPDTAATDTATASASEPAPTDTSQSPSAAAASDTASAGPAPADTATTMTAADGADTSASEAAAASAAEGTGDEGSFFSSTFFVIVLVVVPIAALMAMLITAFRKDREH